MDKKLAREYLIKSKLYRFIAMVFAVVGLLVFCAQYFQHEQTGGESFVDTLKDPMVVVFLVFPFIPSIVLSLLAQRSERKLQDLLKDQ